MSYLIVLLLTIPLLSAVICALVDRGLARVVAFLGSLITAGVSLATLLLYNWSTGGVQFGVELGRLESIGFGLSFGADSVSLWLVALTAFLQPLAVASSFSAITDRTKEYYGWMMMLLFAMLGVFVARDMLLFYIFFELTLVPMFFIIGIWGGPQRREAAGRFFLFTFAGSVFTLAAIIYLGLSAGTFDIGKCVNHAQTQLAATQLWWIVLGFLAGFAVKVPLFPVHTWLPLAHTEAPTAGSVILAGVLLKLGTYGVLRFVLPVGFAAVDMQKVVYHFPLVPWLDWFWVTITFGGLAKFLGLLCLIGIIYGALVAWVQQDIKKLVAYSSVSHLGFCVLGLAALNYEGVQGSILYMINHGLSTGAMFLVIGMIYERYHTRDINELSGLARKMPVMAFFFILFTLSSIGLPGLNGFPSEFLTILGAFKSQHLGITYGVIAAIGIILGAVYMLHMAARVIFGPLKTPGHAEHGHGHGHGQEDQGQAAGAGEHDSKLPADLSGREIGILIPLALAVVIIGVIPGKLLNMFEGPVKQIVEKERPAAPAAMGMTNDEIRMTNQARITE